MFIIYLLEFFIIVMMMVGSYRLLLFFTGASSKKIEKTARKVAGIKKKGSEIDGISRNLSLLIAKYIRIDDIKYKKLKDMLKYEEATTEDPKLFIAENIISSAIIMLPGIFFVFVAPQISIFFVLIGITKYYLTQASLYKKYEEKRREIEYELPRFCAVIGQEVKYTHDVLGILSRYASSTNKALSKELKITIADMNSSNYESALKRFEARLSIDRLAEITRGLIGTVRGDDTIAYFELLSKDFDQLELQRLNDMAARQPRRISKYQFIILVTMTVNYLIIMAIYLITMKDSF